MSLSIPTKRTRLPSGEDGDFNVVEQDSSPDLSHTVEDSILSVSTATSTIKTVVVTGGAGQISYALLPLIGSGRMLGGSQFIQLHLLDIPGTESVLEGVKMEIEDSGFALVKDVVATTDPSVAFKGADVAVLLGGFPRRPGMLRKELIERNVEIMKVHGKALEDYASRDCKVLVVANPANTNCLVAMKAAPSIPAENFSALTRLDHERLQGMVVRRVSEVTGSHDIQVRNGFILGNHSSTQVPNVESAEVLLGDVWTSVKDIIRDDKWVDETLVKTVQERGAAVLAMRKLSSAMSAAQAIANHIHDWVLGTPEGTIVSMGVLSNGNKYGVPEDIIFSFPVRCYGGKWEVVEGLHLGSTTKAYLTTTVQELQDEKANAFQQVSHL